MPKEHERLPLALRQAKIFTGLSEPEVDALARYFQIRELEDDTFLVHEGEPARTFFILLAGQVKILQTSAEGFEVILHILGPGDIIGALPAIGEGTYPASALTIGAAVAATIRATEFNQLLDQFPQLTKNLLRFATRVVQSSHRKIRELATERVERRIARALSRLAGQLGREFESGILLDFPLTRQDLAELTGTTVFTVSRILNDWERQGVLELGRERIVIVSPQRLVEIGEDLPI
ncbi:MAG: Crp/Fnr family transcriptional regulator [Anaerolineales bacterium]|jgi:CRP-like cAMP-binding protein